VLLHAHTVINYVDGRRLVIGTVYGFENRKTVETVRKKIYGFGYGFVTVQNRKEKKLRFCLRLQNRKEKNLRF
jgi:hypothetical protein